MSAFAGFFVLIIGWPLNSFVSKRAVRIQKGVSNARDKRMGVLNELIGAVRTAPPLLAMPHADEELATRAGEIHQVLRMGRRLDRACDGCARGRDAVDAQMCVVIVRGVVVCGAAADVRAQLA